ncbi:MAG: MoaD/ThiS family protein, partial [Planctomycetes bacterium]|nr:MoaD/ThiS family protein [Planctomycetota bacterium]
MQVVVRCFASVRELFGQDQLTVELHEGATLRDLESALATRHSDFARLPLARAVNRAYAKLDTPLKDGDEVAFIPPISGGAASPRFSFVQSPLDPRGLETEVRSDA